MTFKKSQQHFRVEATERRAIAQKLVADEGYKVQRVCEALGIARSSYYRQAVPKPDETVLRAVVQQVAARYPTYGSRRITRQLRREGDGWALNRKRVVRLMRALGLQGTAPRRRVRTTDSAHSHRRYPNRVAGLPLWSVPTRSG